MPAPAPLNSRCRHAPDFWSLVTSTQESALAARAPLVDVANGLCQSPEALVADTISLFTVLHGEMPSLIDLVARNTSGLRDVLAPAVAAFEKDRKWLATLSRETGARVDLAGLTDAETATRGLREAMLTLAGSSRNGCTTGTILAFLTEWPGLRSALDLAGTLALSARWPSLSAEWPATPLAMITKVAEPLYDDDATARALAFGAQQFSLIHAQLFDIVQTRTDARNARDE
ncbi:hypothetical protein KCG44_10155 [Pacificimonas sp. WHA3]|uniref:Uncharacterized protein n=1 Tax=Pacificimonas pallii TaxID=2827236 RepID=A0ABS6SFF4_9SPHN|nr:hypothetical protein [Pacificimonas pallii]MBV7257143.1 hypothetical protein [Pacificimonas pallii]